MASDDNSHLPNASQCYKLIICGKDQVPPSLKTGIILSRDQTSVFYFLKRSWNRSISKHPTSEASKNPLDLAHRAYKVNSYWNLGST